MLAGKLSATHHPSAGTVTAKIDPMPIPFADGMLSRLGRRGAALDLIEEFEDESGEPPASLSPADLLAAEPALLLQKMENRLVRHHLANPDVLSGEQLRKLRYILNFARLADFEPGAAGPGGSRGRGDISVGGQVAPWRSRVVDALYAPLREEPDPVTALEGAKDVLATLVDDQDDQRRVLIERHGSDFSATELDAEVGYKKLVTVLGGGGGAGFVYIGGMQRLLAAGQVPDYMIGSSFGSIIGSLVADQDVAAMVDGGAASNVPVELAWERVRDGRLGTRNACYLAFDCFHPHWDPRHLWLVPITQAVQLQMVRNLPYADHLVRFEPTLSPVNLAPSAAAIDRACRWGRDSVEPAIAVTSALLEPTWWEGDRPPAAEPKERTKSAASSMSAVMAAIQAPTGRFRRWRSRHLT